MLSFLALLACNVQLPTLVREPEPTPIQSLPDDGIWIELGWEDAPLEDVLRYMGTSLVEGSGYPGSCATAQTLVTLRFKALRKHAILWALTEVARTAGCTVTIEGRKLRVTTTPPTLSGPLVSYAMMTFHAHDPVAELREAGGEGLVFVRNDELEVLVGIQPAEQ